MAIELKYSLSLNVTETRLVSNLPAVPSANRTNTYQHTTFATAKTLNAASTPAASKHWIQSVALVSGAKTLDLTALLLGSGGDTIDFTGLKVNGYKFRNPDTNSGDITVTFGASNGYLLGGTAWKMILKPGEEFGGFKKGAGPTVGASLKNIDISGTGTEQLEVTLVAG